jgi:RNase adaptor protein for sRNA GlmZ degradation
MLKVKIYSFSYIYNEVPKDNTENGGGFVFDCRYIYNPGREDEFKNMNGKDEPVKKFLDDNKEMQYMLKNIYGIIDTAVENYLYRNFTDIMISFGCTGGQHRSVYSAEKLNEHLKKKYDNIKIEISHVNLK